jgi:hypothetical protein
MKAILSGRISRDIARGGGAGRGAGFHPVTDIDPLRSVVNDRYAASKIRTGLSLRNKRSLLLDELVNLRQLFSGVRHLFTIVPPQA